MINGSTSLGFLNKHQLGGPNPNKTKEARRRLRAILDQVCTKYGTTVERSRCPMKNNRKVTYLLAYGTVDYLSCFIREKKDEIILIPNNYTVCFEANSHVWLGRIQYRERTAENFSATDVFGRSGAKDDIEVMAFFEVTPVDENGEELRQLSSDFQENISCAFKISLAKMREYYSQKEVLEKASLRPNGRLYIGVYYSTVQHKLRAHLKEKMAQGELNHLKPQLKERIQWWISLESGSNLHGNLTSIPSSSRRNARPNGRSNASFKKIEAKPIATQASAAPKLPTISLPAPGLEGFRADSTLNALQFNPFPPAPFNPSTSFSTPFTDLNLLQLQGLSNLQNDVNSFQEKLLQFPGPFAAFNSRANQTNVHPNPFAQQFSQSFPIHALQSPQPNLADLQNLNNTSFSNLIKESSSDSNLSPLNDALNSSTNSRNISSPSINARKRANEQVQIEQSEISKSFEARISDLCCDLMMEASNLSSENLQQSMNMALENVKSKVLTSSLAKRPKIEPNTSDVRAPPPSLSFMERSVSRQSLRSFSELTTAIRQNEQSLELPVPKQARGGDEEVEQIDIGSFFGQEGYSRWSFGNLGSLLQQPSGVEDGAVSEGADKVPTIVSCNMTPEALYLTLDVKGNNAVGEKEIKRALKCLKIPVNSSIIKKTYEACDKNGDGKISLDEFVQYLREREKELKTMFEKLDLSKDGYVTLEELQAVREGGTIEASDEELKYLIEWMDNLDQGRKDGKIDFEEFRTSMMLFPPSTTMQEIIYCLRNKKQD